MGVQISEIYTSICGGPDSVEQELRAQKRAKAVQELIDTETSYVNSLNICINEYYNGLSENQKIINANDLRGMFNDITTICQLNTKFLQDLQASQEKDRIGQQFIKFCPYFKMYQSYCNNYDNSSALLQKYNEKRLFINYCNEAKQRCSNKTLQSLLITPIQRLPRYKLCLTEIIKNTAKNHSDLKHLKRALKLVEETTHLINQRMKEFQSRQDVSTIQSRFANNTALIKPHRTFIREGILTKIDKNGKEHRYVFFLFNDILCYASGNNNSLKMHSILPLTDGAFFIRDIPIAVNDEYKDTAFEIHSSVKSFVVYCDEGKSKGEWMEKINDLLMKDKNNVRKQASVAADQSNKQENVWSVPLMTPIVWSAKCQIVDCGEKFTLMNRKSHCKYCGKIICAKCGKYRLGSRDNKEYIVKPVCQLCFEEYKNTYPVQENAKLEEDERDLSNDESHE